MGTVEMKAFHAVLALLLLCAVVQAAAGEVVPPVAWQRCLGGTGMDESNEIEPTADGGYIVAGMTTSNDGDLAGLLHGNYDAWLVKLNAAGETVWQRVLGGTGWDEANDVEQTDDGGFIMVGRAGSGDMDLVGTGFHGQANLWVVRLDAGGQVVWGKCLGGSSNDWAYAVEQIADGGYIVSGYTSSSDGDVAGYHQNGDCWLVKLDAAGNVAWQRTLGGSYPEDGPCKVRQTPDGDYIVAGTTESDDGDVVGNPKEHGVKSGWRGEAERRRRHRLAVVPGRPHPR